MWEMGRGHQTFYRDVPTADEKANGEACDEKHSDEISRDRRQYLKEILVSHPIWAEGRFWEQALWQCVVEQVDDVWTSITLINNECSFS